MQNKAPKTITYRLATNVDAAQIAALGAAVWIDTYARDSVTLDIAQYVLAEFTEQRIASHLKRPGVYVWVAESEGGLLGFADMSVPLSSELIFDERQAEVARLYVLERFARKGIGKELLRHCTQTAFDQNATVAWLSVWSGNERALAFYQAQGWTNVGKISFILGDVAHPNDVFALRKTAAS